MELEKNPLSRAEQESAVADLFAQEGIGEGAPVNGASFHDAAPEVPAQETPSQPRDAAAEPTVPTTPVEASEEPAAYAPPVPDPIPAHLASHKQELAAQTDLLRQQAEYVRTLPPEQQQQAMHELRVRAQQISLYGEALQKEVVQHNKGAASNLKDQIMDATRQMIPEWTDPNTFVTEAKQLKRWMAGRGYSQKEINNLRDPRAVRDLRAVWLGEQGVPAPVRKSGTLRLKKKLDTRQKRANAHVKKHGNSKGAQVDGVAMLLGRL